MAAHLLLGCALGARFARRSLESAARYVSAESCDGAGGIAEIVSLRTRRERAAAKSPKPLANMEFSPLEGELPELDAMTSMLESLRAIPMIRPGFALGRLAFWSRYE